MAPGAAEPPARDPVRRAAAAGHPQRPGFRPRGGARQPDSAGHPEGYLEGFAQIYSDIAEQVAARIEGREPDPASLLVPTVEEGVRGVRFISAAIDSSRNNAA